MVRPEAKKVLFKIPSFYHTYFFHLQFKYIHNVFCCLKYSIDKTKIIKFKGL